jgi:hypothetical protein
MKAKAGHGANDAFAPDGGGLNGLAVPHDNDKRDHPGEREIHVVDFLAGLVQNDALSELQGRKLRSQDLKIRARKCSQQLVAGWAGINRMHLSKSARSAWAFFCGDGRGVREPPPQRALI